MLKVKVVGWQNDLNPAMRSPCMRLANQLVEGGSTGVSQHPNLLGQLLQDFAVSPRAILFLLKIAGTQSLFLP